MHLNPPSVSTAEIERCLERSNILIGQLIVEASHAALSEQERNVIADRLSIVANVLSYVGRRLEDDLAARARAVAKRSDLSTIDDYATISDQLQQFRFLTSILNELLTQTHVIVN